MVSGQCNAFQCEQDAEGMLAWFFGERKYCESHFEMYLETARANGMDVEVVNEP